MSGSVLQTVGDLLFRQKKLLSVGKFGPMFRGKFQNKVDVSITRIWKKEFCVDKDIFGNTLEHQNILLYYCLEENADHQFIASEIIVGTLLDYVLDDYKGPLVGPMSILLQQVTKGLKFLHEKEIFHRDLNPENVFISQSKATVTPMIKLGNFGIYRVAQHPLPLCDVAGNKDWMAPEVYESETYSAEMDRYALGLLIAFSLSGGRHPFGRLGFDKISVKIRTKISITLTATKLKLAGQMAVQVFQLIKKLLNVDPSKRPTLQQVLDHPFLNQQTQQSEKRQLVNDKGEPAPKKARYENQNSFGKVVANNEEESVVADTFSDHSSRALHCSTNSVVSTVQVPSHSKPLEKIKRKGFTRKASINGPSSSASLLKSYPSNENNVSSDELEPSTSFSHGMAVVWTPKENIENLLQPLGQKSSDSSLQEHRNDVVNSVETAVEDTLLYDTPNDVVDPPAQKANNHSVVVKHLKSAQDQLFAMCKTQTGWTNKKLAEFRHLVMDKSVHINAVNKDGLTALLLVCWKQSSGDLQQLVTILLEHPDLDVNVTDGGQWNALGMACRHCQNKNLLDVVRLLLERGIQVNNTNGEGNSALMALCANYGSKRYQRNDKQQKNFIKIVRLLIEYDTNVNLVNNLGANVLHMLCCNHASENLPEMVQVLLDAGVCVNTVDVEGNNPLLLVAANYNHENIIKIVRAHIDKEVDVNIVNSKGWDVLTTLLHFYRGSNFLEIVKILLRAGANVHTKTQEGLNPLLALLSREHYHDDVLAMARLLIRRKVDIHLKNEEGLNALHLLCIHYTGDNFIEAVKMLLDKGIDAKSTNSKGQNSLFLLLRNFKQNANFIPVAMLLLKSGVSIHWRDENGCNLLHFLCYTMRFVIVFPVDFMKILRFLVEKTRIDLQSPDASGNKATHLLKKLTASQQKKRNVPEMIQILKNGR